MTPPFTPPPARRPYTWKRYEVRCACGAFIRWSWSPTCGRGRVKPLCAGCETRREKGER